MFTRALTVTAVQVRTIFREPAAVGRVGLEPTADGL